MQVNSERIALINEMLTKNPDDAFLKYAAALEHKKYNMPDKAIALLEELIRSHPDYLPTYYQIGKLYEELGQTHIAIKHYKNGKLLAAKVNDKKALGELSEALMILDADEEY